MRIAMLAVVVLAACASGDKGVSPDAQKPATDAAAMTDATTCGAIDQLPCDPIYVATTGNDNAAGTKGAPLKTITKGIAKAKATARAFVIVGAGVYTEQISMVAGVNVLGGFDESWTRNLAVETEIDGASPVIEFANITIATTLDGVTVKASDAGLAGESSFAVIATGSQMIELRDVEIEAGIGAAGGDGTNGVNGSPGGNGAQGNPGVERSTGDGCTSKPIPAPGSGGGSVCGMNGGIGGVPGVGNMAGQQGGTGGGGTMGGFGGGVAGNGGAGFDGITGSSGPAGSGGPPIGAFINNRYAPAGGASGQNGVNGTGGGGGGGGGGGVVSCDSTGSSGGGGGGGGCAGTGGVGGAGGGGSFGVISIDSLVTIRSSKVTASRGGAGGRGGTGGTGGTGGLGMPGGPYGGNSEQDDGGQAGGGGPGGTGGNGGPGGGGGGGPSAAVVCVGTGNITIPQSTLTAGTGGAGGTSFGNSGQTGIATNAIGCNFF